MLHVIFIIAIPQVATMLIDAFYNMADAYFVSQIGDAAISAVGVNDSLMHCIRAISLGFGVGSASFIARALGAKRDEDASRAAITTLLTAVGALTLFALLCSFSLLPLVNFLGATDAVRPYSMEYARWILISAPITAGTVCLSQILRSEGNTFFAMMGSVSGCIINLVLDPIFIYTLRLGVAGAAIATGISKLISLGILITPFILRKTVIILRLELFTPTKVIYAEIARMGIPTMLRAGALSLANILTYNMAARFGDVALAAVSVANKSIRFVSAAVMGFGQGFQPVAGYSWGAKKYSRVLQSLRYTLIIGAVIGIVLGTLLCIFARQVMELFSSDSAIIALGIIFIRTQSVVLVPHVWGQILASFFTALGLSVRAGILGLSRQLFSLVPSVLILSYLFGELGLAYAQATADVITLTLAIVLTMPVVRRVRALYQEHEADTVHAGC
jgi:putative MATE family efflux protein